MSDPRPEEKIRFGKGWESEAEGLSLLKVLDVARRRKLWVVLPLALVAAAFVAVALLLPDVYEANVLVRADSLVTDERTGRPPVAEVQEHLAAIRESVYRRSLLETVIREFDLYEHDDGRTSPANLEDLRSRVGIKVEGEETFQIGFHDSRPERAAAVAARITELFVDEMADTRQYRAATVDETVETELKRLEQELARQRDAIADYQRQAGETLPGNRQAYIDQLYLLQGELQRTDNDITNAEAQLAATGEEMRRLEGRGVANGSNAVAKKEAELASARQRYTENHPEVQRLQRELDAMREAAEGGAAPASVDAGEPTEAQLHYIRLEAQLPSLEARLDRLERERNRIQQQLSQARAQMTSIPGTESHLAQMEEEYDATKRRYDELFANRQNARLTGQLVQTSLGVNFRVVEPARVPEEPSGPHRLRIILMGLVAGLGCAVALTFVVEQTDASFGDLDEFREYTDLPVMASIPAIKNGSGRSSNLVTLTDPLAVATEQYRILAMRVRQNLDRNDEQVLMLTSSAGGEGKTTTSINLGVALAELVDGPVLLMDCDLRWPRVHEYLNSTLKNRFVDRTGGFADLLKDPEQSVFRHTKRAGRLYVVAGNNNNGDSFETLVSSATPALLRQLRKHFKYILLDAPPILPMADSHALADLSDRVLLVVRARQTRRELLQRAAETFDFSKVLGVVLNDVDYSRTRYAYAYDYYSKNYYAKAKKAEGP